MKILLVEDDPPTSSALAEIFGSYRYLVNLAADGQTGLGLAQSFDYDLIVLDVMIPHLDGISVCQRLRQEGHQQPILLLTAKDSRSDRILGLDAGADDYVVKPFDADELMARVRALLRRGKSATAAVITWENVKFDSATSEVSCNGELVRLTPKEYCLLELLLLNPKRVFSRRAILDRLWDFADSPGEETVSTHIKCLRQKLKAAGAADLVETVHGLGYRLREASPPQAAPAAAVDRSPHRSPQNQPSSTRSPQISRQRVQDKTTKLLEQFRGRFIEQWAVLEQAAIALSADALPLELQEQAKQEAHKLAGSLGIFGLKDGSEYAKALEELLQTKPLSVTQAKEVAKWVGLLRQALDRKPPSAEADRTADSPLILIVDDDLLLADRIRIEAIAWGLRVEIATDLDRARNAIEQSAPDVILLDLTFPGSSEDGLSFLQTLSQRPAPIPVLVFTGRGSLRDRLAVAQLGGSAFLQKPLPTCEILKAVTTVLSQCQIRHRNRVLVVDDDVNVLARLSGLLQPLGIDAIGLDPSAEFWQNLSTIEPNLLILNSTFSSWQGVELCQAVRGDPKWRDLPVLFWSADPNPAQIDRAFAVGADDYLSKAIDSAELVARIVRRLPQVVRRLPQVELQTDRQPAAQ